MYIRILLLVLLIASSTFAQTPPRTPADLRAAGLEVIPLLIESFGLTIHLPQGAAPAIEKSGSQTTLSLTDTASPPSWSMRVQSMTSTLANPTATAQIDDLLNRLRATNQPFTMLRNEPMAGNGWICYLRKTAGEGQDFVQGWLVLPRSEQSFLVWTMIVASDHFGRLEPIFDDAFQTITLQTASTVSQQRIDRIQLGQQVLASFTPEKLRTLDGTQQWLRLSLPAGRSTSGETTEVGYSLVSVGIGPRGLLNPGKRQADYTPLEHEEGLVVRVAGRLVGDAGRGRYIDTDAIYWMAMDQSEETWNFRATQRQGDASRTETETGLRTAPSTDDPNPSLTVIKSDEASFTRLPYEWQVPDVYLSQGLGWVLARLLPRDLTEPMEMGFYFYNARGTSPQMALRIDQWSRDLRRDDRFVLTTRLTSDGTMYQYTYDAHGQLVSGHHHTGVIVEPIDPQTLRRIWRSKGLQVGGG